MRHARCCHACLKDHQGEMVATKYHTATDDCDFCGDVPESEVLYTLYPREYA